MPLEEKENESHLSSDSEKWLSLKLEKIPHKLSFRIGEVSKILSVQPYVLRYWENEFEQLKPSKMDNKQRLYFHKDIETLFLIKKLLYKDGFSIRGAKQALRSLKKEVKKIKAENQIKKQMTQEVNKLEESILRLKVHF